jgi:pantoate--beta-alanine ligase
VKGLSERWEGEARPGHFDGVATVVAKLLCAVRPDLAFFGEKDFQQLAVIRRMAQDLQLGVEVLGVGTVRDEDGLALSSRNAYLSPEERSKAVELPRTLDVTAKRILSGTPVPKALGDAESRLEAAGFSRVDYFALVNAMTLEPLERPVGPMRLIAAAVIGSTRLIDNIPVDL